MLMRLESVQVKKYRGSHTQPRSSQLACMCQVYVVCLMCESIKGRSEHNLDMSTNNNKPKRAVVYYKQQIPVEVRSMCNKKAPHKSLLARHLTLACVRLRASCLV